MSAPPSFLKTWIAVPLSVYVETNSAPKLDYIGRVSPDGTVSLPSTLAIVEPDDPSAQVRIRVIAFQEQKARVLRDVLTTVPHERTALLRLPLSFLDDGSGIGALPLQYLPGGSGGAPEGDTLFQPTDPTVIRSTCDFSQGQTSVAGVCASAQLDSTSLPDYGDAEVFGEGGSAVDPACFDVQSCLSQATQITNVDMASCSFPMPTGEDGKSWNCALATTDGTGACFGGTCFVPLDSDPVTGFTIHPGSSITMAPGICKKLAAGARLYVDKQSCATKVPASPVCEPTQGAVADAGPPPADGGASSHDAASGGDSGSCRIDAGLADASMGCTPRTCLQQNIACGPAGDGGGGGLQCGTCTLPQYCGGGGFGQCGGNVADAGVDAGGGCNGETCAQQNITCGPAGDGCGNQLSCGTCTPPQTCGGGGVPSQCG